MTDFVICRNGGSCGHLGFCDWLIFFRKIVPMVENGNKNISVLLLTDVKDEAAGFVRSGGDMLLLLTTLRGVIIVPTESINNVLCEPDVSAACSSTRSSKT